MSMDRLPSELLLRIFRFIDDIAEKTKLELVCQRWRKIMRGERDDGTLSWYGWKHIRRVAQLRVVRWIEPLGERCGDRLVECSFHAVCIRPTLLSLIAQHFPALKHLEFRSCQYLVLDSDLDTEVQEMLQEIGVRLRSLTFIYTDYFRKLPHLLYHSPHLRHLGFHIQDNLDSSTFQFPADLRSLYLSNYTKFSTDLLQMLTNVHKDSPKLAALYLEAYLKQLGQVEQQQLFCRISELRNLRFLRVALNHIVDPDLLCNCLNNLSQLVAFQLNQCIDSKLLPGVFRSRCFHGLVHLSLTLHDFLHCKSIGLLSTGAPKLRSLNLDITTAFWQTQEVACQVLKIANNGTLEHLNVPCASFTIDELVKLIQLCPNLHSLCAQIWPFEEVSEVAELQRVVADQWQSGTRKYAPLRVWKYGNPVVSWNEPFLTIHTVQLGFAPPNPVLNALFREEVFNDDKDGGGTPSFVTEHYSKGA